MEIFITITGFENYSISNLGNCKNVETDKILKPQTRKMHANVKF